MTTTATTLTTCNKDHAAAIRKAVREICKGIDGCESSVSMGRAVAGTVTVIVRDSAEAVAAVCEWLIANRFECSLVKYGTEGIGGPGGLLERARVHGQSCMHIGVMGLA